MAGEDQGYLRTMSENTENTENTENAETSESTEQPAGSPGDGTDASGAGYDAAADSDADPEMMNPRDLIGEGSGETDPDLDPDSLNPRGDA